MAAHAQPSLSISVRATTTSSILDLAQQTPFTISLTLTLDHTHPITFDPRSITLFNGNILYDEGLTFTNTATGELVPRNTRNVCHMNTGDDVTMPSEQAESNFVTLHPGKEHMLHATLRQVLSHGMFSTQGLTAHEIVQKQSEQRKTWKWPNVSGMQDGEMYQVKVSNGAGVRSWIQGSVEALVEARRAGLRPEMRRQIVPFLMVESARFEMRRPDMDGSLDWL
jgi:hypothetical protein